MKKYIVIKSRTSEYPNPIKVSKAEKVICLKDSNPNDEWANWVYCKSLNNEGWIPKQIIDKNNPCSTILEDYNAYELNLEVGEELYMIKELNGWIWSYKINNPNLKGWAPLNCIVEIN